MIDLGITEFIYSANNMFTLAFLYMCIIGSGLQLDCSQDLASYPGLVTPATSAGVRRPG